MARPASERIQRIQRLAEGIAGLSGSPGGKLEVEEELVQGVELVDLLQDALHCPVRLGADALREDGANLEQGLIS